ncbi:Rne/Rng family ribonuclease [Pseudothermotoga thermarum]|uniref:Ribonuclease, Rne/Rng family n=1 Tax=Pseudothermotoga thermarum DSM 5069 TaxID=688269 RepID=F7YV89_9THEM|nr:Rne/Rng family ribonuclease [Pseudothermotoga thermarum]AEH50389.1 ribonuclease, Rne/Rng family [Pseudothermotoga thermarum DSM 5069]
MAVQLIVNVFEDKVNGAILEEGVLQELFIEELQSISGNLYVGKVEKIVPGLNAAFVNIGESKNAFLKLLDPSKFYISEVLNGNTIKEGSKILVQIRNENVGTKGPLVTTKISLVGRFVVYFPLSRIRGISKKISDSVERERLKKIFENLGKTEGVIIRTASEYVNDELILEELSQLRQKWQEVLASFKRAKKPKLLMAEPTAADFIIRERLNKTIDEIIVNSQDMYEKFKQACKDLAKKPLIRLVEGDVFEKFGIYNHINQALERKIFLPSGGYVAIDITEALTVFDVNSASFVGEKNHAELAHRINIEAAREIARQLRLRNIGGMIIVDFIDVPSKEYRDKLVKELQEAVKKDSARVELIGFTKLGLFEMTRKRKQIPLDQVFFSTCPICKGSGKVTSPNIVIKRLLDELISLSKEDFSKIKVSLHQRFSGYHETIKQKLPNELKNKVVFSFDHSNPNEYLITLVKKG